MPLVFEWDAAKAAANVRKHGVTFEEAATVFADPLFSVPLTFAAAFDRLTVFSMSSYLRGVHDTLLDVPLPHAQDTLKRLGQAFPSGA